MKEYYFDNSATSHPKPKNVYESVNKAMVDLNANPGRGSYKKSLEIAREIYSVREKLANFFNIKNPLQIAFTANATMSLNMALKGTIKENTHIITTFQEHNSVLRPLNFLKDEKNVELTFVDEKFEEAIKENTAAVVVNHISNVTGRIMPIKEIGKLCKKYNILFIVDVSQSAGFLEIDVEEMGIDVLCFTGHKSLFGIQGIGGIYVREGIDIKPLLEGGTGSHSKFSRQPEEMPDLLESGTLNTPGILSLGAGIDFINKIGLKNIQEHEKELTKRFLKGLKEIDNIKIYGNVEEERGPVVSLNIEGVDPGEMAEILDEEFEIMVRAGFHCAPLMHSEIGTYETGTVRFSFGYFNTVEDIDYALRAIKTITENI